MQSTISDMYTYTSTGSFNTRNTDISQSRIVDSTIDMNNRPIENVQDPIFPQQSATKNYVDSMAISSVCQSVILQSTSASVIESPRYGSFKITIQGPTERSPTAIFVLSRPTMQTTASRMVVASSAGCFDMTQPPTYLLLYWEMNQTMMLSKTNDSFDGTYKVYITPSI